jgi:trehalose synthase
MHLEHDVVIVHDPQALPLVQHYQRSGPWFWCCHVDLSTPNPVVWDFLESLIERYDAAVFSLPEYAQNLRLPQRFYHAGDQSVLDDQQGTCR